MREMSVTGKEMLAFQEEMAKEHKYKPIPIHLFYGDIREKYLAAMPMWCKVDDGDANQELYSLDGTLIATGYERVVIGDYGAFVEISKDQMVKGNLKCKEGQEYRYNDERYSKNVKYLWLTPKDNSDAKIYYQKKAVEYADYKPGYYYISPYEVWFEGSDNVKPVENVKISLKTNNLSKKYPDPYFKGVPNIGDLHLRHIVINHDYPVLMICKSGLNTLYFCHCCNIFTEQKWLIAPTTFEKLENLFCNQVSIRKMFTEATGDCYVAVWNKNNPEETSYQIIKPSQFDESDLADEDAYVDANQEEHKDNMDFLKSEKQMMLEKAFLHETLLKEELCKMDTEIDRCYELASQNLKSGNDEFYYHWNSRAQAFRAFVEIVEEILLK